MSTLELFYLNLNRYMIAFLMDLVRRGWFQTCIISYLPVGHTHTEEVDGSIFGVIGASKNVNEIYSPVCKMFL